MADILILGAGFGGLTVAHALLPTLARGHTLTVVDRKDRFRMGLAKLWVLVGERSPEEGWGDLTRLDGKGVRFVKAEVNGVDLAARRVRTSAGDRSYDRLIVAMGAELAVEDVPGLPAEANLYDAAQVPGLRDRLGALTRGTLALVVCGTPYKCPPAPFEAVMLADAQLRARGVRESVRVEVTIPDPNPMPVAGPAAGEKVRALLSGRGVTLRTGRKPTSVDAAIRKVHFADGETLAYDLLLAVPPHRAPRVIGEAGLTDASGFIPVDPQTLRTAHPDVWAIGDVCAVKLPGAGMLPKAGILAELQAEVVAGNLLAELAGKPQERAFDGTGYCFFEVGDHRAMLVEGAFFSEPGTRVRISEPSAESFARKRQFEQERLARWFG